MQDWTDIRRQVLVEGASQRSVCRQYGIAHKTLQKILAHSEPPGYRQQLPRPKTKLGPYLATIEEILAADRGAPAKQRHTGKRIFERLRDEHGYAGGITQVRLTVARLRRHAAEVYVPLAHRPGGAQFDFGEASVRIAGDECKAHFAVMSLPYSDAFFVRAYPRECTETFQDAHAATFAFFGGVPTRTDYDNSKIAVARIVGRERELTREFLRLEAHFLFSHRFCRVGRGNEKGHVEVLIAEQAQLVAVHKRVWAREQVSFDPLHYLALLERKPGAFDVARPLADWRLPDCFALLRRRLEASLGQRGTREYVKVLRLLEHASLAELAKAVMAALAIGATSSDAIALILCQRAERAATLSALDGHPHLQALRSEPPDLRAYAALRAQRERS